MAYSKNTKGIIYRIYSSGASDKVVNLIDDQGRKVSVLAKGVRKANSRKSHSIDIGNYVSASLIEGYNIPLLTEVKLINEFSNWKNSFLKITILQYFCEVIDKFILEEEKDFKLYQTFTDVLNLDTEKILFAAAAFSLKIIDITGHLPSLQECLLTNEKFQPNQIFAIPDQIGYVSEAGVKEGLLLEAISDNIYKTQKFILINKLSSAIKINLGNDEVEKMFHLHSNWIEIIIEKKLKSKEILLNIIK